jgi:uncharacterized protein (TIGR00369 family)
MTLKEYFKGDHFASLVGAELIDVREGYAKARLLVTQEHLNGGGVCQGGAIFTLADLAFAGAVNSHGTLTLSTNANIVYVHPAQEGYLYAEAHEIVNPSPSSLCRSAYNGCFRRAHSHPHFERLSQKGNPSNRISPPKDDYLFYKQ